jgi:hypothetical protein
VCHSGFTSTAIFSFRGSGSVINALTSEHPNSRE